MIWTCSCGGEITEQSSGIDWDDIDGTGSCIARSDLECDTCERKFQIFYNLDRIECINCEESPKDCKCERKKDVKP